MWSSGARQPASHMAQGRFPAQSSDPSNMCTSTPASASASRGSPLHAASGPPPRKRALSLATTDWADAGGRAVLGLCGAGLGSGDSNTTSSEAKRRRLAPSSRSVTYSPCCGCVHGSHRAPILGSAVMGPAHFPQTEPAGHPPSAGRRTRPPSPQVVLGAPAPTARPPPPPPPHKQSHGCRRYTQRHRFGLRKEHSAAQKASGTGLVRRWAIGCARPGPAAKGCRRSVGGGRPAAAARAVAAARAARVAAAVRLRTARACWLCMRRGQRPAGRGRGSRLSR
eukprot:scaffold17621_cov95-Isochrysis_galbana.AAC.2